MPSSSKTLSNFSDMQFRIHVGGPHVRAIQGLPAEMVAVVP